MLIHTAHDLFLVDALEPSVPRVTLADQVAETLGEPLPTPQPSTSTTSTTTSAVAALAAAGRKVQGADYNDDDDDDDSSLDDDEGWDDDLDGMESTSVDAKKVNSWQQGTSSTAQYTKHRCAMDASSHSILAFVFLSFFFLLLLLCRSMLSLAVLCNHRRLHSGVPHKRHVN